MGTKALIIGLALIVAGALGALMPWIIVWIERIWQR